MAADRYRLYPWFVVRTKVRQEFWAAENIQKQGAEWYLPRIAPREPLFPGYMFVRTHTGLWRFLQGTFGVSSVVMRGDQPAPLPFRDIAYLRRLENAEGHIVLPAWAGARGLSQGDHVHIIDGPFVYFKGLVNVTPARDRVQILLNVLGRATVVELGAEQVEPL